jgi:hypothetical protein
MAISLVSPLGYTAGTTGQDTVSVAPLNKGDLVLLFVRIQSTTITITGITGGSSTGWAKVANTSDSGRGWSGELWMATATAVGAANATITYSSAIGVINVLRTTTHWTAGLGPATTWTIDDFGAVDKVAANTTIDYPSLTAEGSGELYVGHCLVNGSGVAGATSGFTYANDTNADQIAYNTSVTGTVDPSATHSGSGNSFTVAGVFAATSATRTAVALTHVGSTTWDAPASSAATTPTYPSSLLEDDVVYAVLHIKPDTATVATPAGWALVGAASGGSGTQGAGTGATRVHVYRRTVPAAGLSGTETFTITSGSSPTAFMRAYRATGTNVAFPAETFTSWSVTTASTTIGGTAGAGLDLAALDEINAVLGSSDDQATTLTLTGLTATGATLGALTRDPNATVINAQGNDISSTAYRVPVSSGTSNVAPVATATSNSSETAMGFLFRVRATADAPAPPVAPQIVTVSQAAIIRAHYW